MKSPWKFLAQFIPQRLSAETRETSIGDDPDVERSQTEGQRSSGLPLDAAEPSGAAREESGPAELVTTTTSDQAEPEIDVTPGVAVPDDVEESHAPTRRQTSQSTAHSDALRVESELSNRSSRKPPKKLARARRTRTDMSAQSAVVADLDKSSRLSSPRDPFFDELAGLDADIKQLRIQLARKLHLQNDQLKKMLKRFDVS